jgi:hypothetical protein
MAFPSKPILADEQRTELLRLLGVPDSAGVYVLGCFARYVTIHAQQVRALNLIDSLAKGGAFYKRSAVAVIGGGIAGITAATAAAIRGVGRIVVFERESHLLFLQRTSEQRYVHPHIYDWPAPDALEDDAGLPVLSWEPERAAEVVSGLAKTWSELSPDLSGRIEVRTKCGDLKLRHASPGTEVGSEGHWERFDVVILAVGFGRDSLSETDSYWTDSRIDGWEAAAEAGDWLVSGAGDGALTDLMRLCIDRFRHKEVLEAMDAEARRKVGADLERAESEPLSADQLAARYLQAADGLAPELAARLKPRPIGKVWLNCTLEELFRPRSSRLNRLICAWLLRQGRFEIVSRPGRILPPVRLDDRLVRVDFADPATEPLFVRHVVQRHGPREDTKLQASFPEIAAACSGIESEWRSMARQDEDWTKEPLYEPGDFDLAAGCIPPLRVDFGGRTGCVVVERGSALKGLSLERRAKIALERFDARYAKLSGLVVDPQPIAFSVTEVFASSAAYERMVRALCHSPIVIFDITGYEPAVLLLLGIRAAARRGITVTVTEDAPLAGKAGDLPFNIGALNPVHLGTESAKDIAEALQSGFEAFKAQPDMYLDLPAYDALRKLGEDHRVLEPETQILFLRWFDPQYKALVKELVEAGPQTAFPAARLVTTLDSRSPQLVEQRLYAAIRRTRLCIADWTGWRPSVFFEIGVRLAVNETDPVFIRCAEKPRDWNDDAGAWPARPPATAPLEEFFQPTPFTLDEDEDLRARFRRFVEERSTRQPQARLSPGRTYAVVKAAIDPRQEPGGVPVHDVLLSGARTLVGEFVVESGNSIPVLFADALGEQVRASAVEHVLAAWFYLNGRYGLLEKRDKGEDLSPADRLRLDQLENVWKDLSALLRQVQDPRYDEIRDILRKAMRAKISKGSE